MIWEPWVCTRGHQGSSRYNLRSPRLPSRILPPKLTSELVVFVVMFSFCFGPALKKIGELMWFSNFHIWPFDTLWTSFITYPGVGTGIFFPMKAPLPDPLVHSSGLGYVMLAWLRSVSEIRSKFVGFVLRLVMSIWTTHIFVSLLNDDEQMRKKASVEHQLVFLWGVFHLYHGCFIHLGQVCAENIHEKAAGSFVQPFGDFFPKIQRCKFKKEKDVVEWSLPGFHVQKLSKVFVESFGMFMNVLRWQKVSSSFVSSNLGWKWWIPNWPTKRNVFKIFNNSFRSFFYRMNVQPFRNMVFSKSNNFAAMVQEGFFLNKRDRFRNRCFYMRARTAAQLSNQQEQKDVSLCWRVFGSSLGRKYRVLKVLFFQCFLGLYTWCNMVKRCLLI